jgi:hypothetical protein
MIATIAMLRTLSRHKPKAAFAPRRKQGRGEGLAQVTLGNVARISMILDPDGNWIELSRRASIVGSLS